MTKSPGIYSIRFGLNERIYIGSAMNLGRRKSQHLYKLRRNIHDNPKLQNYYNKYGEELFSFNILEIITDSIEVVRAKEQEYFNKYYAQEYINSDFKDRRFDTLLLNVTPEVDIMRVHWTDERKKKLIERNRNYIWTDDQKEAISKANKGREISAEEYRNKTLGEIYYWRNVRKEKNRECPNCGSDHVRHMGMRHNKTKDIMMRRCICMSCNKGYSKPVDTGSSHSDV